MGNLKQLREKFDKGLYVDNLYQMASLCKKLALEGENPASFFIMQQIFSGIAKYWEDRPISVEEAKLVEAELKKPIENVLDGIEQRASSERILQDINKAVSSYLFLFR